VIPIPVQVSNVEDPDVFLKKIEILSILKTEFAGGFAPGPLGKLSAVLTPNFHGTACDGEREGEQGETA